ncbi:hypothetical protein BpHYR1_018093 [Brachionus plicatilis]|uniref:Uncharacterized protein n=1 Tax=Brachionus plicatilis TaxID=10195 RepID=A0A3M7SKG9_BRAPC|nr:hypothetical protein BpHYR1_018093 [Brachionus plicatilis]
MCLNHQSIGLRARLWILIVAAMDNKTSILKSVLCRNPQFDFFNSTYIQFQEIVVGIHMLAEKIVA